MNFIAQGVSTDDRYIYITYTHTQLPLLLDHWVADVSFVYMYTCDPEATKHITLCRWPKYGTSSTGAGLSPSIGFEKHCPCDCDLYGVPIVYPISGSCQKYLPYDDDLMKYNYLSYTSR